MSQPSRTGITGVTKKMSNKHKVDFFAREKVKEPVTIDFVTKDGKEVTFPAHKEVTEEVEVKFMAKDK